MQLFDDFERSTSRTARYSQNSYDFLNHSAWQVCNRARHLCNAWYSRLPIDAQPDLRARLMNTDSRQHVSAYFELLLHEVLLNLGLSANTHPQVPTTTKRPDFLVGSDDGSIYIEAMVCHSSSTPESENDIVNTICDWIDDVPNPYYWVSLSFNGTPKRLPRKTAVTEPVRQLMARHEPESELSRREADNYVQPIDKVQIDDAALVIKLTVKPRERWGIDSERTIGVFSYGDTQNILPIIRDAICKKAKKKQASHLGLPLVIACNTIDGFFDLEDDSLVSLFGLPEAGYLRPQWEMSLDATRDEPGVWIGRDGKPRNENVAAIWLFKNARPVGRTPAGGGDCLFINPFANHPLPTEFDQVSTARVCEGRMSWNKGVDLSELLDVPHIPEDELTTDGSC